MLNYLPNYSQRFTVEQALKHLAGLSEVGFRGPGWYRLDADAVLVLSAEREVAARAELWDQRYRQDELFVFHVYTGRSPVLDFQALLQAPMRT